MSREDLVKNGGGRFLKYYEGSITRALMSAYPQHNWAVWKSKHLQTEVWRDVDNQRAFFNHVYKQLGLKCMVDWISVSDSDVHQLGGKILLNTYYNGSSILALQTIYPEHNWVTLQTKQNDLKYSNNLEIWQ